MSAFRKVIDGSLKSKLVELIRLRGPLSVTEYMKIVLTNPESGFYMNKDVFGVKGHFTTNPEISQVFGEVLGVWIMQEWKRFNCPQPLQLVEFGPGRGTLISDIARTLNKFEQTKDKININLIEISPRLKEIQQQTLSQQPSLVDRVKWNSQVESLEPNPDGFTAFIAHEFLDALPIYKFVRDPNNGAWRELLIDYDAKQQLRFCISRQPSLSTRLLIPPDFEGDHIEICPDAALQLQRVAKRLNETGKGCMIVCDYGFEDEPKEEKDPEGLVSLKPTRSSRDTFRAFKDHEIWPPLKDPGEADLTADVDFGYIKKQVADRSLIFGSVNQRKFLTECGMEARLKVLLEKASESERDELLSGAKMMLEDMGYRYRFMAMFPKDCGPLFKGDPPAGFSDGDQGGRV